MRKAMPFAVSLLLLAGVAQARDLKPDIDAANQKFVAAFTKGDAAGIAALYTDRATVLPPGADMVTGREAIQKLWAGAIQSGLKNVTLQAVSVESYGASAAREIGRFSFDAPNAQKQMSKVEGKYVVVWKRVKGAWKLDTDIWNTNQ